MSADDSPSLSPSTTAWINATEAAAILEIPGRECGRKHVARLANDGLITSRSLPGVRSRYLRADVQRLARESVKPAIR